MKFADVELARKIYYEKSQQVLKKRKKIAAIICAIVFVVEVPVLVFLLYPNFPKNGELNMRILILATVLIMAFMVEAFFIYAIVSIATHKEGEELSKLHLAFKRAYKAYFVERQLSSIFSNLDYNHDKGLDRNLLKETGLIHTGDIFKSNDLVKGKYKNNIFSQADVEIIDIVKERDKDGNEKTHYETVFKGRYLVFEPPKKLDFKMVISFNGVNYFDPTKTKRGLSRVETESADFNKRFLVYAEDGFEAFYVLNPAFMENLEELGEAYNNALSLYFSDGKLFIGLNDGNDAFEPSDPSIPLDEKKEEERVINDMKLITNLVDKLNLSKE